MSKYYKALQSRKPVTAIPNGLTRSEVVAAIASLNAELKGPMHNAMRISLVHDRDNFRDVLALMNKQESPADERDGCSRSEPQITQQESP